MKDWVKVCGIQNAADAKRCFELGVDAIGLNLWSKSPRCVGAEAAAEIASAVRGRGQVVVLSVNHPVNELTHAVELIQPDWLQFHGDETPAEMASFGEKAFKAIGLSSVTDVDAAKRWPGSVVLVDARDAVLRGGTGTSPPVELAKAVCSSRPTILAGGLTPENVHAAIMQLGPVGVDTASGVERGPGVKDFEKIERFVQAAKGAFKELGLSEG